MIMPLSFLLTINVSDKACTENQTTHFFNNVFENALLWDNIWKYDIVGEVTDNSVILGQVIKQNQQYMYIYFKQPTKRVPISSEKIFNSSFNIT
jgi:hypothetical protein